MRFYARPSWQLVRQVVSDLFVVAWGVAWWFVGRFTDGTIRAIAEPARQTQRLAADLQSQATDAAAQASGVPLVGEQLRRPFDGMSGTLADLAATSAEQVAQVERVAGVTGWLVFLIPVLVIVVIWLPRRLAFGALAAETRALVNTSDGNDLLALRALATQPLAELRSIAPDPVAAWRRGDPVVTERLAELELVRAGVVRPRRRRQRPIAT